MKFGFVLLMTGITLAILFIAGEITLRVTCAYCSYSEKQGQKYMPVYDRESGSVFRPYIQRMPYLDTDYDRMGVFSYGLQTNGLGIRDVDHPVEKRPGEFRIIALGDSYTEGVGAPVDSTWFRLLQTRLNERLRHDTVRVISGGVFNSDPVACYNLYRDCMADYQPDIVILAMNCGDINDIYERDAGDIKYEENWFFRLWVHSHFFRFLIMEIGGFDWHLLGPRESKLKSQQAIQMTKDILIKYQQLAHEQGFEFLLVVFPGYYELERNFYDFNLDRIIEFADSTGMMYTDLKAYFRSQFEIDKAKVNELYWEFEGHCRPEGYYQFALGVEEALERYSLIPDGNQ